MTSDKMSKTRRVVVERLVPHPKYGKMLRRRTVCHAHDEANASHMGDVVEIMETRPFPSSSGGGSCGSSGPAPSRPWPARTRPPTRQADGTALWQRQTAARDAGTGRHDGSIDELGRWPRGRRPS